MIPDHRINPKNTGNCRREIPIPLLPPRCNLRVMTPEEGKEYHARHQRGLLVPAGLFIGLGIGLLAGYPAPGLMIGLGLGFIGSALLKPRERPAVDPAAPSMHHGSRWMPALLGIFFIILGLSLIWAPQNFWPYIGAGFLILMGIWFIARSFGKA
jgi:hypothetical protein